MDRRAFIVASVGALATPRAASGQRVSRIPRVGSLSTGSRIDSFSKALQALGYVDGRTIIVEQRSAEGQVDRLPAMAAELVQLNVDVIVAWGAEPLEAARKATSRIPIVIVARADPVAAGLAASLGRPGGQVTGVTTGGPELAGKRLQLLTDALPGVSRVAILRDPSADPTLVPETESAAHALNLYPVVVKVSGPADFDAALQAAVRERAGAVLVNETSMISANRAKLAELAVRRRVPVVGTFRFSAEAGFLMSYGPDFQELSRRAASYVDRILQGARPGELPIEQPTKYELIINLKTAKALGLTIPPSLLLRADQVIE